MAGGLPTRASRRSRGMCRVTALRPPIPGEDASLSLCGFRWAEGEGRHVGGLSDCRADVRSGSVRKGPAAAGDYPGGYALPPGWQRVDRAVATVGYALTPAVAMPGSGRGRRGWLPESDDVQDRQAAQRPVHPVGEGEPADGRLAHVFAFVVVGADAGPAAEPAGAGRNVLDAVETGADSLLAGQTASPPRLLDSGEGGQGLGAGQGGSASRCCRSWGRPCAS